MHPPLPTLVLVGVVVAALSTSWPAMEDVNASPDYRTAMQRIDAALSQLDQDESALQPQIGDQSVRAQWAQEDI